MKIPTKNYAFIDGSFNPKNKVYGGGGILIDHLGNRYILFQSGNNPKMSEMRNVAGEIIGAELIIKMAVELGMKKLTIFHDYEGIAKWATGKWKCNKSATRKYQTFVSRAFKTGLKIHFQHVKAHSGILKNDEVDALAKKVVGL